MLQEAAQCKEPWLTKVAEESPKVGSYQYHSNSFKTNPKNHRAYTHTSKTAFLWKINDKDNTSALLPLLRSTQSPCKSLLFRLKLQSNYYNAGVNSATSPIRSLFHSMFDASLEGQSRQPQFWVKAWFWRLHPLCWHKDSSWYWSTRAFKRKRNQDPGMPPTSSFCLEREIRLDQYSLGSNMMTAPPSPWFKLEVWPSDLRNTHANLCQGRRSFCRSISTLQVNQHPSSHQCRWQGVLCIPMTTCRKPQPIKQRELKRPPQKAWNMQNASSVPEVSKTQPTRKKYQEDSSWTASS